MTSRLDNSKIFCFLFGVWIFFRTVGNIDLFSSLHLDMVGTLSKFCLIAFGMCIIVFSRKTLNAWVMVSIYLSVSMITFLMSKNMDFFFSIFIVLVMAHLNIDAIYKSFFQGMILGIIFVLLLFMLGVLPDIIQIRLGAVRHSFGFSLPVILPALFFSSICAFLYLYRNSYTWKLLLAIFVLQIPIYYYCDGRGSFILSCIVLLGAMIIRYLYNDRINDILVAASIISLFVILFFSIYLAKYYDAGNTHLYDLNQQLTGRPQWWNLYWNTYNPKLFGQVVARVGGAAAIENSSLDMMILDNGYLSILLEYGIFALVIFLSLIVFGLVSLWKKKDTIGLLILMVWIFYGLVSNQIYFIDRNVGLVLTASFLSSRYSLQGGYGYGES